MKNWIASDHATNPLPLFVRENSCYKSSCRIITSTKTSISLKYQSLRIFNGLQYRIMVVPRWRSFIIVLIGALSHILRLLCEPLYQSPSCHAANQSNVFEIILFGMESNKPRVILDTNKETAKGFDLVWGRFTCRVTFTFWKRRTLDRSCWYAMTEI